jgi:hypothetical protein
MDIVPHNYVSGRSSHDLTMNEQAILGQSVHAAGDMIARRQMGHLVRSEDSAVTVALGNLIYSGAYAVAALLITAGIFLMAWLGSGQDGNGWHYFVAWLVAWGVCILIALAVNKWQGLHHSSTGIAHHEIRSRERMAMYIVDRHIELIEKKWGLEE